MAQNFRIIVSPRVSSDLHEIFHYIEKDSPHNAAAFIQKLIDAVDALAHFPNRGMVVEGTKNTRGETRISTVPPYIIYYRVLEKQLAIRVITIRHGARQQPRRFH